jgi:hypothetical protein
LLFPEFLFGYPALAFFPGGFGAHVEGAVLAAAAG